MESTLARVKSILKINVTKSVDQEQDSGLEQRLDKIEAELASVTSKLEKIADNNKVSNSLVLRLDSTLKNTIREEKNDRLKFEVDLEEKVMTANNDMSRNFTEVIEKVNEVLLKHDKLIKDTHKEAMKINQTVEEYINDMDESFENLQNDMTETKIYFSNIEDADITGNIFVLYINLLKETLFQKIISCPPPLRRRGVILLCTCRSVGRSVGP